MPMTSAEVLGLLDQLGSRGVRGAIEAVRRRNISSTQGTSTLPASQRALLDAVANAGTSGPRVRYKHPEQVAVVPRERDEPLSAAQVAWLSRLPTDPAQITHADAVEIFRLLKSDNGKTGDLPLLRSIADPVRTHHDRLQAQADLEHARLDPVPIPAETLRALADAIANDIPQLTFGEALDRASEKLREVAAARMADQADRQTKATRRLAQIDADEQARLQGVSVRPDGRKHLTEASDSAVSWAHYRADHGDQQAQAALTAAYSHIDPDAGQ